jgi:hypothetical protein
MLQANNILASTAGLADKEADIARLGLKTVMFASLLLILLILIASKTKDKYKKTKKPLFVLIAATIIIPTFILFGSTVYLNVTSESKGPVHWHTGIEFWSCGAEVELRDPQGALTNKIGTSTYHEHNDKFIHLEGVVVTKSEDASLEKFMAVTGGYINDGGIGIPLNKNQDRWFVTGENNKIDGDKQRPENYNIATGSSSWIVEGDKGPVLELKNGNQCSGAEEDPAEVQAFVYRFNKEDNTYSQTKLSHPKDYIMRDEPALGPPADCVIVEYDAPKERTDKLCQQYGIKDKKRCTEFGVESFNPEICYIEEVPAGGTQ